MADDRALSALQLLRGAVEPDAAFSDVLFEQLAADVDFDGGTVRRPSLRTRLRRPWRLSQDQRRVAWLLVAAALLILGLVVSITIAGAQPRHPPPLPSVIGEQIPPGRYSSGPFTPEIDFQLGAGWMTAVAQAGDGQLNNGGFGIFFSRPDTLVDPASGDPVRFAGDAAALVSWLGRHPALSLGAPEPISLTGAAGFRFQVRVRDGAAQAPCENAPSARCVVLTRADGGGALQLQDGALVDAFVLDVHDRVVIVLFGPPGPAADQLLPTLISFP